jgi:hypothetical protein
LLFRQELAMKDAERIEREKREAEEKEKTWGWKDWEGDTRGSG